MIFMVMGIRLLNMEQLDFINLIILQFYEIPLKNFLGKIVMNEHFGLFLFPSHCPDICMNMIDS